MGSRNKSYGRSSKGTEHKGLHDNTKGKRDFESIVEQTTQSRPNSEIKVKICSAMFLYSKEG